MVRDRRQLYYEQIADYFSSSESASGLHSAAIKEWTQHATGSHEPSHLVYNIGIVTHQRCIRNTLTKLSKQSLFTLASHFREISHSETQSGKYPLDLIAKLNVKSPWARDNINLTNLVVANNQRVHAHSTNLQGMIDDARFSLEVALSEYATIAPQTEREWKAERQAYRATALARPIPKNIKLEFTPPISWTEKETS